MSPPIPSEPKIPFDRVSQLVRQVTHDVRNGLSAVDLQAALLTEVLEGTEAREETVRLRDNIGVLSRLLENLADKFQGLYLSPIAYEAGMFVEDAKVRFDAMYGDRMREMVWAADVGDAWVEIDVEAIFQVMEEVLKNAFSFAEGTPRVEFAAEATPDMVLFRFSEKRSGEPENLSRWGREPFLNIRSGRYGLGLFRARLVALEHGGDLRHSFDARNGRLITVLSIPVVSRHG